jgi:hypothetical protein
MTRFVKSDQIQIRNTGFPTNNNTAEHFHSVVYLGDPHSHSQITVPRIGTVFVKIWNNITMMFGITVYFQHADTNFKGPTVAMENLVGESYITMKATIEALPLVSFSLSVNSCLGLQCTHFKGRDQLL